VIARLQELRRFTAEIAERCAEAAEVAEFRDPGAF